jgi:hypothetical protein
MRIPLQLLSGHVLDANAFAVKAHMGEDCLASVYECISLFLATARRYRFQRVNAQVYFSGIALEPLLCCILGLLLLRIRSCSELRGLSFSKLPFWISKADDLSSALPENIKSFLSSVSYADSSFQTVSESVKGSVQRLQKRWNTLRVCACAFSQTLSA